MEGWARPPLLYALIYTLLGVMEVEGTETGVEGWIGR